MIEYMIVIANLNVKLKQYRYSKITTAENMYHQFCGQTELH